MLENEGIEMKSVTTMDELKEHNGSGDQVDSETTQQSQGGVNEVRVMIGDWSRIKGNDADDWSSICHQQEFGQSTGRSWVAKEWDGNEKASLM